MKYKIHRKEFRTERPESGESFHVIRYDPWFRPDRADDPDYFPAPLIFVRKDALNGEWEPARVFWSKVRETDPTRANLFAKAIQKAVADARKLDRRAENGEL